jgi:two-component system chemotaxis response regulator CheB
MIRVLIVDDSIVVRKTLREIFLEKNDIEVVAEAVNGNEAFYFGKKFTPDIITMDIHMPGGNGLVAIEKIMAENPTPILILSSSTGLEDDVSIFQLLKYGVVDIFEKPDITEWDKKPALKERFFNKIYELSSLKKKLKKKIKRKKKFEPDNIDIVSIVSSTGGPKILKEIMENISKNVRLPIVCVQHISQGFVPGLVSWLNSFSNLPAKIAQNGEKLVGGTIYFAPADFHIEVSKNRRILLNKKPTIFGLRPAGDYLLSSMESFNEKALGIILTGMGSDGTKGLKKMYIAGGYTIVQDEDTSIVWGMPKSALDAGCVDEVLNTKEIIERLNKLV